VPEEHAIAYWRPVHDGADAVAFLQEHEGCGRTPLALRSATASTRFSHGSIGASACCQSAEPE
jgi:hypothetical protein